MFLGPSVLGLRFPDLGGRRSEFSRHLFKGIRDKTACYHAANTILAFKDISQRSGTCIQQLDQTSPIHKNERVPTTVTSLMLKLWICQLQRKMKPPIKL